MLPCTIPLLPCTTYTIYIYHALPLLPCTIHTLPCNHIYLWKKGRGPGLSLSQVQTYAIDAVAFEDEDELSDGISADWYT